MAKSRWELAILGSMSCFLKGLSGGTWPEKSKEHFGKSIPRKAKTFAQGIAGIVASNNNGTTYTYPKAIWTFLQKHSSYDIERVAQDVVKGIETTDAICHWCVQPRIVGKDYYEDGSWYCKSCFLSWQGIGPRGMSDKGRLNKSKKGKFSLQQGCQRGRKPKAGNPDHDWQVNICQFKGRGMYLSRAGGSHSRERKCLLDLAGVVFLELSELPVVVQSKVHSILAQSSLSL